MPIWLLLVLSALFFWLCILLYKRSKVLYATALSAAVVLLVVAAISGYFAWAVGLG